MIELTDKSVITIGDNNNKIDPYIIKFKEIKSKIIAINRGKKTKNITGGRKGYIIHKAMPIRKYAVAESICNSCSF